LIAQLLNRDFVLGQLAVVRAHLELDPGAFPELLAEIVRTERSETECSSGQRGGVEPPPAERRGGGSPELDDIAFFSRSPLVSLVQSALERYVIDHGLPTEALDPPDPGRRAVPDLPAVADQSLRGVAPLSEPDGRRLFGAFELADVGWVASMIAAGTRVVRGRHPFTPRPAGPRPMANRARVVLVGDWGSGLPRARAVAARMRTVLEDGMSRHLDQHVVHLGDVYYSGWDWEYDQRFLAHWPVATGEAGQVSSWALNGNHDMYSGGDGYFGHLLADPRFAGQEGSSFFSLHNDDWEILGLDTAWDEGGLADPQPAWVGERLAASGRRFVLLSHHQLVSAYQRPSPALGVALGPMRASGRARAWFWGHEHRCMHFRPHGGVAAPRCIGHGGVPSPMWRDHDEPYPAPASYEYRAQRWSGVEPWALFGFAVLDFDGPTIRVRYIDEDGTEHANEELA